MTRDVKHLVLAHLSENCNAPDVAVDGMRTAVGGTRFRGTITAAKQDTVMGPVPARRQARGRGAHPSIRCSSGRRRLLPRQFHDPKAHTIELARRVVSSVSDDGNNAACAAISMSGLRPQHHEIRRLSRAMCPSPPSFRNRSRDSALRSGVLAAV